MRMRSLGAVVLAAVATLAGVASRVDAQPVPNMTAERPGATLLLPYFEVDLANPAGANTFFSINNASATAVLGHVTIWSDYSVPVLAFDVYLTGYDMQTIDLRAVLNGTLPRTASAGQDPTDTISNRATLSQDINFASCYQAMPTKPVPALIVTHAQNALTGLASPVMGSCASKPDGTRIARGYVTVDTVNSCSFMTPADPGYFPAIATNQNVLFGDYAYTNHLANQESSDASALVQIMADPLDADLNTPGNYTFYSRLVGATAADYREPLSTTFGARYYSATSTWASTSLTVWRDVKRPQNYFGCSTTPSWYPLAESDVVFFDETENVQQPSYESVWPLLPGADPAFPKATQRVVVGGAALPSLYPNGWAYLNLNTVVAGQVGLNDPTIAQAWVGVHYKGQGRYGVGFPATAFDTARNPSNVIMLP